MVTEKLMVMIVCDDLEDLTTVLWPCRELEAMADLLVRFGGLGGGDRKSDGDDCCGGPERCDTGTVIL